MLGTRNCAHAPLGGSSQVWPRTCAPAPWLAHPKATAPSGWSDLPPQPGAFSSRTLLLALGTWAADRRTSRLCCWRVPLLIRRKKQQQVGAVLPPQSKGCSSARSFPDASKPCGRKPHCSPAFLPQFLGPIFMVGIFAQNLIDH